MTCQPAGYDWHVRLFVNGKPVAEGRTKSLPSNSAIPDSFFLGAELCYFHDAYYRSLMTDVRVIARSLDAPEMVVLAGSR